MRQWLRGVLTIKWKRTNPLMVERTTRVYVRAAWQIINDVNYKIYYIIIVQWRCDNNRNVTGKRESGREVEFRRV